MMIMMSVVIITIANMLMTVNAFKEFCSIGQGFVNNLTQIFPIRSRNISFLLDRRLSAHPLAFEYSGCGVVGQVGISANLLLRREGSHTEL